MVNCIGQQFGRISNNPGNITTGINHSIPGPPLERLQVTVPVPTQLFNLRIKVVVVLAPIKKCDFIATLKGNIDDVPS
jgi:hypothetical protein